MEIHWVDRIANIHGVVSALIVDLDGLVMAQAGSTSEIAAAHSSLFIKKLVDKIGIQTMEEWLWTQCETENMIIAFSNVKVGVLVVMMSQDVNLSLVRIEAYSIRQALKDKFEQPFPNNGSE